jgi:FAD/FMN-containing dehydrogenase
MSGHTYGSLSNLIVSLTAVVWDQRRRRYVLRRFDRSERDIGALLVHLGRTFVVEAELRVGANGHVRCQSFIDIPVSELFAAPNARASNTLASYVEEGGGVEAIWYPFTDRPWLKVWTPSPTRPAGSRAVSGPYNYPFSDNIPVQLSELATSVIEGDAGLTPLYGQLQYDATNLGLPATGGLDIWGPSKDVLLYIRPTTIRETANGYAVHCARANIQRVVSEFAAFHRQRVAAYQERGSYPVNMPVEIRVTGLDHARDVGVPGARPPILSALRPHPGHPEWDVAVWIDVLTFAGTRDATRFYKELETWMFANYSSYASVRPEWSKGWAFTDQAAWSNPAILQRRIPSTYRAGHGAGDGWDWALATLDRLDPHRIFTNPFLDRLTPARR